MQSSRTWLLAGGIAAVAALAGGAYVAGLLQAGTYDAAPPPIARTATPQAGAAQLEALRRQMARMQRQLDELRARPPQGAAGPSDNATMGVLLQELAALNDDVTTLRRALRRLESSASSATEPLAGAPDPYDGLTLPEAIVEEEARHFGALSDRHAAQAVDPGWSLMAAEAIENAFDDTSLAGMQYSALDCRTTLCRVEILLDDDPVLLDELPLLLGEATGNTFTGFSIRALDRQSGTARAEVFLNAR